MELKDIKISEIAIENRLWEFDKECVKELAKSIREIGLINPIVVFENEDKTYTLISGEHRLRACKLNKQKTIAAIVHKRTLNRAKDEAKGLIMEADSNLFWNHMDCFEEGYIKYKKNEALKILNKGEAYE